MVHVSWPVISCPTHSSKCCGGAVATHGGEQHQTCSWRGGDVQLHTTCRRCSAPRQTDTASMRAHRGIGGKRAKFSKFSIFGLSKIRTKERIFRKRKKDVCRRHRASRPCPVPISGTAEPGIGSGEPEIGTAEPELARHRRNVHPKRTNGESYLKKKQNKSFCILFSASRSLVSQRSGKNV